VDLTGLFAAGIFSVVRSVNAVRIIGAVKFIAAVGRSEAASRFVGHGFNRAVARME